MQMPVLTRNGSGNSAQRKALLQIFLKIRVTGTVKTTIILMNCFIWSVIPLNEQMHGSMGSEASLTGFTVSSWKGFNYLVFIVIGLKIFLKRKKFK
jgi:hypothetical protein